MVDDINHSREQIDLYQLAKHKVLEEIKAEIEKWLKQRFWVIVAIIAVVGFVGADKMLSSLVRDEVEKAISKDADIVKKMNESLAQTQIDTKVLQQKVSGEWSSISLKIKEIDQKLQEINEKSVRIDKQNFEIDGRIRDLVEKSKDADIRREKLSRDLQELDLARKAFSAFIGEENTKNILQKIYNDHYRIRSITLDVRTIFRKGIRSEDVDRMQENFISQVDFIQKSGAQSSILAQFRANGMHTMEVEGRENEEVIAISQQMGLFPPFERKLRDRPIDYLSDANFVAIRDGYQIPKSNAPAVRKQVEAFYRTLQAIEINLIVNNIRCHGISVTALDPTIEEEATTKTGTLSLSSKILSKLEETTDIRRIYDERVSMMSAELRQNR